MGIEFFYKNICVPIMFSHVLNGVSQVLDVFPIMFPIAQDFYPIGFAQSFPLFPYIGGPNGNIKSSHRNLYFEEFSKKLFGLFVFFILVMANQKGSH